MSKGRKREGEGKAVEKDYGGRKTLRIDVDCCALLVVVYGYGKIYLYIVGIGVRIMIIKEDELEE